MERVYNEIYFSRAATWSRLGDRLLVHDSFTSRAPRMITMEEWHEVVFLAADGEHTIGEFVAHMGAQYKGGPPKGLEEQIHGIVSELVEEGIIRLHDNPTPLPPYFATDEFQQDPQVRATQMRADGLIS